MHRSCARPACADPAVATLSYDYAASTVWILALVDEPGPMAHGLCNHHADTLVVPRGWTLDDRRSATVHRPGAALASEPVGQPASGPEDPAGEALAS